MRQRRPRVLIVDDEDNIVLALHRVLYQDNERYDVLLARTAEIAQQILHDAHVDVMVTDVHLPEKSGMDLLSWTAVESPATRVIVMTAFDISGIKDQAHAFGCLRLTRKPFDVHEMRATIRRALDHGEGFAGKLSELSMIDLVQMLCISRKSTALRFSHMGHSGVVSIEEGEVVHAVWNNMVGEEAFYQMISAKAGAFHTFPPPPDMEKSIKGSWQHLLMEGVRRQDEHDAGLSSVDPPPASPDAAPAPAAKAAATSSPRPPPTAVDRLIDQGFVALKAGLHDEAKRCWEEALRIDPNNRMLELNIRKLQAKLVER